MKTIIKRDGRVVPFDVSKIAVAMKKAFLASKTSHTSEDKVYEICLGYASAISAMLDAKYTDPIDIEDIQNEVELFLMSIHPPTAKAYILYRQNRSSTRKLMQTYHGLATLDAADSDLKRENVEMDGDPTQNLDAFESIVKCMGTSGVGYGAINHPADHDPVCGFNGIINNECPRCGRREENGQSFERIRRITGYLVGTVDRFNNAKRAEELDRVKHRY